MVGNVNSTTVAVGNVGTGEDNLMSYTVPANTLGGTGDYIDVTMFGTFANTANNKRVKVHWGTTVILDTGALAFQDADWTVRLLICRVAGATQRCTATFTSSSALLASTNKYTAASATLTGTVVLKATGEATDNDDIQQLGMFTRWNHVN
jgi:hypothetical protein